MMKKDPTDKTESVESEMNNTVDDTVSDPTERPREIGGRGGLDPTRYGDWEKAGRCIDF